MTDITNYSETSTQTDSGVMHHSEYKNINDFKIVIGKETAQDAFHLEWDKIPFIYLQNLNNSFYNFKKEELLLTGIKNLRKNLRFIQLTTDLASKIINDEQFESEIEKKPDNFIIDIRPIDNPIDAILLHEIVNKLGDDLSIDEAGDIFSFESESIKEYLNKLSK